MDLPASTPESSRTEFRLLKPMPSRQEAAEREFRSAALEPWDTQIRRLFPPRDTPPARLPPVAGIRLGHFEIEERIARGGMGTVFRARDLRLDRLVALKVLSQEQLRDPAAVQRFQNEARAAAKLDHENIARVYFIGEDRGVHFIAFEYVRGTTVREAIAAKGRLTQDEAVNYTLQAAEALRHTDRAGVVHRDIKPSNLIVTPSGRVKLVDLGLARQTDPNHEADLTVTGTTLGTFDYISPEQARDPRNVDVRSDIYSLGCTLFHMLTGSPPYAQGTTVDKLVQHSTGRPPDPAELNPRVSPRLSLVVQRMMAANPDERYPSPQALIDDLSQIAEGLGLRATAPEGTIWRKPLYRSGSPRWEENRGWIIAFAVIMVLAVVGDKVYQLVRNLRHDWIAASDTPGSSVVPGLTEAAGNPTPRTSVLSPPPSTGLPPQAPAGGPDHSLTAPASTGGNVAGTTDSPSPRPVGVPPAAETLPLPVVGSDSSPDALRATEVSGSVLAQGSAAIPAAGGANGGVPEVSRGASGNPPPPAAGESAVPSPSPSPGTETVAARGPSSLAPPLSFPTAGEPFLVYGPDGTPTTRYVSLEAACHAAKSGSVIEIDHDGLLPRPERPLLIQGKRLTIRPAARRRPVIHFRPHDVHLTTTDVRMIEVVDGTLELYDIDLVMEVSKEVAADRWVFLSLVRPRKLELQRVTLTIHNSGWKPAVMLERRMPGSASGDMIMPAEPQRTAEFDIRDCLFRGRATFLVDRTLEPATVRMADAAVVVDGSLLRIEGADRADMEGVARTAPVWRCELDHVTAVVGRHVLHLSTEELRDSPDIRLETRNSILDADDSWVRLEGHQDSDWLLQRVVWTGIRNVLVGNPETACLVRGLWPQSTDEWTYSLSQWPDWIPEWSVAGDVVSRSGVLTGETHFREAPEQATLSDLALRPMEGAADQRNPALGLASDGSDAGFRPSLSSLPPGLPGRLP